MAQLQLEAVNMAILSDSSYLEARALRETSLLHHSARSSAQTVPAIKNVL